MKKTFQSAVLAILLATGVPTVQASANPFLGEIDWFAGNFPPRGWAFCDGQLLSIASNSALFSLLGTTYGGDGRTTFALPDVRGRVLVHAGIGPGLTPRRLGERGGNQTETLNANQLPSHNHLLNASPGIASQSTPTGNVLAGTGRTRIYDDDSALVAMHPASIGTAGGGQAHNNMQPYNVLSCIIAITGTFPSRN